MCLLWMMHSEPISHLEAFFEILFCPNLRIGQTKPTLLVFGSVVLGSLSEAVFCRCISLLGLCTWSPSCYYCSPLTLLCCCTDSFPFCTPRANENGYKTDTCSWRDSWGKGLVLPCSLCSAWFCLLGSMFAVRSLTASRSWSTLARLRKQKWPREVQDLHPALKSSC